MIVCRRLPGKDHSFLSATEKIPPPAGTSLEKLMKEVSVVFASQPCRDPTPPLSKEPFVRRSVTDGGFTIRFSDSVQLTAVRETAHNMITPTPFISPPLDQ
jgi:hypothetical protein